MSDIETNLGAFDHIWALADVDWRQASALARGANLIVRTSSGRHGVLTGVNFLGNPEIEVDQRARVRTDLNFSEITATGYAAPPKKVNGS